MFEFHNDDIPKNMKFVLVEENGNKFLEPEIINSTYKIKYVTNRAGIYMIQVRVNERIEVSLAIHSTQASLTLKMFFFL